jgi:hypothetical protein
VRLDDPLLAIGVNEHHRSFFEGIPREDLSETWKVGADERSSIRISSRTFRDPVLDRGIKAL